jgi:hypothetical protein
MIICAKVTKTKLTTITLFSAQFVSMD